MNVRLRLLTIVQKMRIVLILLTVLSAYVRVAMLEMEHFV